MAIVKTSNGKDILCDDEDVELLESKSWYGGKNVFTSTRIDGKLVSLPIARFLLNPPDDLFVDHVNRNPYDNRRCNLRLATQSQNEANKGKARSKNGEKPTSSYKGVSYHRRDKRWVASIDWLRSRRQLGRFKTDIEGAIAYDNAAIELHGEFAVLNFPERIKGGRGE